MSVAFKNARSRFPWLPLKPPFFKKISAFALAFCLGLGIALSFFKLTVTEIPILGFHDIIDLNNPDEVPPRRSPQKGDYTQQNLSIFVEYLVQNNYWLLSTDELYDYFISNPKKAIPPERREQKPILLTFDDGYQSAHRHLFAIAEQIEARYRQKIKVVWFVNPAFLGLRGSQLERISCEDLRLGFQKGYYDIQSHGLNHLDLTKIDAKKLDRELKVSRTELKACLQDLAGSERIATQIAYPFGAFAPSLESSISRYYQAGYLYNSRIFRPHFWKNRYQIPRLTVAPDMSIARLKLFASGNWL